jgi:hypothetical protein
LGISCWIVAVIAMSEIPDLIESMPTNWEDGWVAMPVCAAAFWTHVPQSISITGKTEINTSFTINFLSSGMFREKLTGSCVPGASHARRALAAMSSANAASTTDLRVGD